MLKHNWVVIIVAIVALCLTNTATAETLATAIAAGKVSATFRGTGGSSGDAVFVTVKKNQRRAGRGNITLTVAPGMRLNSGNSGEQDMVIAGVKGIVMDEGAGTYSPSSTIEVTNSPQTYVLDAYCAEFDKDNPSDNTGFAASSTVDPKLACILTQAARLSVPAKQAAVWIYTDNATFDHVNAKFQVSQSEWNAAKSVVKKCKKKK